MGWLGRLLGGGRVELDPARQEALLQEVRHRFGPRAQVRFAEQADAVAGLLDGDDGLCVAARIVGVVAEGAHTDLQAQAQEVYRRYGRRLIVQRRNYRPLWKEAGQVLRWPLFALPGGFHPYAQLAGAVMVVGAGASRLEKVTDPVPLATSVFELLDLTLAGWEYGRVRIDTDAASLADRLIVSAGQILADKDDAIRLPPAVRELMRRNNTVPVYDPAGPRSVGGFNPGARMREVLLA